VAEYLTDHGIGFKEASPLSDGWRRYRLDHCPFDESHVGKDVAIFQGPDGKLGAKCLHNSCRGLGWQEFKAKIGTPKPHHYDPPLKPRVRATIKGVPLGTANPDPDDAAPPAGAGADAGAPVERRPAAAIIREYLTEHYRPTFRRGGAIYSDALGREVKRTEAVAGAPSPLIVRLADLAKEAAKLDPDDLPRLFRNWAPTAWADLIGALDDEEHAAELSGSAEHEFRARIKAGLLRLTPLGFNHRGKDGKGKEAAETEVQRRPLIDWCAEFATDDGWGDVRGHRIWAMIRLGERLGAAEDLRDFRRRALRVALRPEVFLQLGIDGELGRMNITKFSQLAELYGVGCARKVQGGATRTVELTREFIAELFAAPGDDPDPDDDGHGDSWEGEPDGRTE